MEEVRKILNCAKQEEIQQLADILKLKLTANSPPAQQIIDQLCWKYQGPLKCLTFKPIFYQICEDIAVSLNVKISSNQLSCWDLLHLIVKDIFARALKEMDEKQWSAFAFIEILIPSKTTAKGKITTLIKKDPAIAVEEIMSFPSFSMYDLITVIVNQVMNTSLRKKLPPLRRAPWGGAVMMEWDYLPPLGATLFFWILWTVVLSLLNKLFPPSKSVVPATLFIYGIYERLREEDNLPF